MSRSESKCNYCGQVIYWRQDGEQWIPLDTEGGERHACPERERQYEKRQELEGMYAAITSDLPVETKMGIYFETCRRCGSHLIVKSNYFPLQVVVASDKDVSGLSGGYLPCKAGRAACDCSIGIYIHEKYKVPYFDDLYPKLVGMYKHDLMLLYFQRITGIDYREVDNDPDTQA